MTKLRFDSQGKLVGIGDKIFNHGDKPEQISLSKYTGKRYNCSICGRPINHQPKCL